MAKAAMLGLGLASGALAAIAAPLSGQGPAPAGQFAAGEWVYRASCAGCHDTGVNRAPQPMVLREMTPEAILAALTTGVMKQFTAGVTMQQKADVAEYLA